MIAIFGTKCTKKLTIVLPKSDISDFLSQSISDLLKSAKVGLLRAFRPCNDKFHFRPNVLLKGRRDVVEEFAIKKDLERSFLIWSKDSVGEQKNVTKCHIFRKVSHKNNKFFLEPMEGET